MIAAEGMAEATFVEGRNGQALRFDGSGAMRALLDLHPDSCPKITISAWIKVLDPTEKGARMVVSTGKTRSPGLKVNRDILTLNGPVSGLRQGDVFRDGGEWVPVTGVYDFRAGTYTLHWRGRSEQSELGDRWAEPEDALWVGAMNDRLAYPAKGILIDELRITGGALDHEEVVAQQEPSPGTGDAEPAPVSQPAESAAPTQGAPGEPDLAEAGAVDNMLEPAGFPETWQASNCEKPGDCPTGAYCGLDRLCHPERHRPMPQIEIVQGEYQGEVVLTPSENPAPDTTGDSGQTRTTFPHPAGPKRYSRISGSRGEIVQEADLYKPNLEEPFNKGWLKLIRWSQRNDRPCKVEVQGSIADSGQDVATVADLCGGTSGIVGTVGTMDWHKNRPISRIQICHNDRQNRRLKGLRTYNSSLGPNGEIGEGYETDVRELTNCKKWAAAVMCPEGTLGTGLVIHATLARGTNRQIVGLQLICREISTTP